MPLTPPQESKGQEHSLKKLLFFKKRRYNFASLLVISLFLGAEASLIGALMLGLIGFLLPGALENSIAVSFFVLGIESLYFLYALYRIHKRQVGRVFLRSLGATVFLTGFNIFLSMTVAILIFLYVSSTTPSFLIQAYPSPDSHSVEPGSPYYPDSTTNS